MNILITGGSGFLGSVIKQFLSENHVLFTLGRNNADIICDLSKGVPRISENIDAIIHAAGKAHSVPKSQEEEDDFFRVNFKGTKNLCFALEKLHHKPKTFIFISTVAVYGMEEGELLDESHHLKGKTPYAISKIKAEEWLQKWTQEHGITLGVLRLPLIAGPNPPGNLGAMVNGIRHGYYLGIGKSDARKSMVWAEDIATIIPRLAEIGGIYNLTDGYHPTFKELEDSIASAFGKSSPYHVPIPLAKSIAAFGYLLGSGFPISTNKLRKMMSTLTFDDSKAREMLNWKPTPVLQKIQNII